MSPIDATTLTELVRLVDDLIDTLKEQAQKFVDSYMYVLRYGWEHGGTEKCREKENEVFNHWRDAKQATESGDANALQNALARASDDLAELAECLGFSPLPF